MFRLSTRSAGRCARAFAAAAFTEARGHASQAVAKAGATSQQASGWGFRAAFAAAAAASLPLAAAASSHEERSFIMIKPDGVHRGLIAEIIARFERKGYKLVGIKVVVPSKALAEQHYAEHKGRPFFPKLTNFLSSGAVVAMVWEGRGVISFGRTMIGATNPLSSAPGTVRGDLAVDVGRNVIHGSDSIDSAQKEIALWFGPDELAAYDLVGKNWVYEL
ncbi:unnamed protein product [Pedinophyceae sp. YPF-701]|nr:unnamed protein product [Pedinophyceae sp. YPF-701]